jgi:hypothetical protein
MTDMVISYSKKVPGFIQRNFVDALFWVVGIGIIFALSLPLFSIIRFISWFIF